MLPPPAPAYGEAWRSAVVTRLEVVLLEVLEVHTSRRCRQYGHREYIVFRTVYNGRLLHVNLQDEGTATDWTLEEGAGYHSSQCALPRAWSGSGCRLVTVTLHRAGGALGIAEGSVADA